MDVSGHDCGLATIEYRLRRFSRFGQSDRRSVTPEAIARTRKIVGFYSKHAVTADRFLDFPLPCSIMIANPFHPYCWWNDSFGNFSKTKIVLILLPRFLPSDSIIFRTLYWRSEWEVGTIVRINNFTIVIFANIFWSVDFRANINYWCLQILIEVYLLSYSRPWHGWNEVIGVSLRFRLFVSFDVNFNGL